MFFGIGDIMSKTRINCDGISTTLCSGDPTPLPVINVSMTILDSRVTDNQYDKLQNLFRKFVEEICEITDLP